jgi:hypothetical protein
MLEYTSRRSGLLVAEQAAAPRQIRDALKRLDDQLVLGCEVDDRYGCWVWRVFRRDGDRPAQWLFDWRENMEEPRSRPRPLSHALVDEAASRRLGSRRVFVDPDVLNDRAVAEARREASEVSEQIARETVRRARSPVHRSVGLRMSRDKQRARGRRV